ncbi:MAG: prolyl oligopeptidase family serine peptidase [Rhodothermales bacterium]|nr:prolyl oligopeptidase family serine peptidase [Rhodothermales bacterium]MBO6780197.1 prolyl oligopeptidase family serine peptidase [Rhodothermales bacterium]
MRKLLPILMLLVVAPAAAQTSSLTVQKIMQDPDTWVGSQPNRFQWSEDGDWLYFQWNPQGAFASDSLFKVPAEGGEPVQVTRDERLAVRPTFSGWSHGEHTYDADFARKIFSAGGDLYIHHRRDSDMVRLTATGDVESSARFTPDGQAVVYVRDGNAYRMDLGSPQVTQLTNLQSGRDRNDRPSDEQDQWLEEQQTDLFDVIRERQEARDARDAARELDEEAHDNGLPPVYRYGDSRVFGLQVDPSERYASFSVFSGGGNSKRTIVQNYVTESGYAEDLNARAKVGVDETPRTVFVQDLDSGDVIEVDLTQLPGAYDVKPIHLLDEGVEVDSSKARVLQAGSLSWSGDGAYAVLQVTAGDNKDRWIVRLDPATGDLTTLDRQTDDAWIGGPNVGWFSGGSLGWLPDNRTIWFQSEESGYSHLYSIDVETGEKRQLTSGMFEVTSVFLTQDGSQFLLVTSEASPHSRHVYRMSTAGGEREQLTIDVGQQQVAFHPSEDRVAIRYSTNTQPFDLFLQEFGQDAERITHSTTSEWEAYDWRQPELVHIPASDGARVPGHLFEPENPNGGVVMFVHGAGYLQNVHNWWSSYFREYMFHNLLTDLGYTVLQLDFRASSGYGRDWRTAIYRHMGGRDLQDYVDASRWMESEHGFDPERVFIYGGSYGGFITLMALFTEPEHFGGGAALRSVTDWAHYNHGYTSNILNTPVNDSLAFARSSPINFADGLEDPLLMPHGVIDTNVQYQDIIRLAQRLIELGKEDWEVASYPVEGHGFTEPSSWTDEYRRILKLIEETVGPDACNC